MTCRALLVATLLVSPLGLVGCGDEPPPPAPPEPAIDAFARQHEAWVEELARPEPIHVAELSSSPLDEALARFSRALPDDPDAIRDYSLRAYRLGAGAPDVQLRRVAGAELGPGAGAQVDVTPLTDPAAALVDGGGDPAVGRALVEAVGRVRADHPALAAHAVGVQRGDAFVHRGVALVDLEAREVLWLRAHPQR